MTLNLSRLLRSDSPDQGEVNAEGEFQPDPATYPDEIGISEPLHYNLTISSMGHGEYLLTGHVQGDVTMQCRRCLDPVTVSSDSELIYTLEYSPGEEELTMRLDDEEDEVLLFGKPEVDFALLLTEVFTVDLPLTVNCPEGVECRDLARLYGTDPEYEHAADKSPFAALRDFDPESKKE